GKAGSEKGESNERPRRAGARCASPQSRSSDGGCGSGGPMEPLLHSGSGGGNAGGGTVAYDAAAHYRILSGIECGSSGFRGGDTLSMGAGSHLRLRTRSAGGQPAINGRVETAQ